MTSQGKKIRTTYQGVRYREHPTRKHGGAADKYFYIRTYHDGKEREEGLGWSSEGWTAKKAATELATIKTAQTTGKGPQNLAESRASAKAVRDEKRRQQHVAAVSTMTFCQAALDYFLPWSRRNKHSWPEDVARFERHLWPTIGTIPIRELTKADVEAMLDVASRNGLAPATLQQCFALTRRICNFCSQVIIHGETILPGRNPCSGIVLRLTDNARLRFLSYAEADRLIDGAQGFDADNAMHDMIVLAINTGMRLGEMQRLKRPDVDLEHDLVHILDRNGKPGGVVYLNEKSRPVMERRLASKRPGPLVFSPPWGGKVRENISQRFKVLADALGFNRNIDDPRQRVVFHTLRHTFASWLALSGKDIYTIKELMRHKTLAMAMRYAHLIPDAKRQAVLSLRPTDRPESPKG
jgi:integrase